MRCATKSGKLLLQRQPFLSKHKLLRSEHALHSCADFAADSGVLPGQFELINRFRACAKWSSRIHLLVEEQLEYSPTLEDELRLDRAAHEWPQNPNIAESPS